MFEDPNYSLPLRNPPHTISDLPDYTSLYTDNKTSQNRPDFVKNREDNINLSFLLGTHARTYSVRREPVIEHFTYNTQVHIAVTHTTQKDIGSNP